jgi:hypothetical protein
MKSKINAGTMSASLGLAGELRSGRSGSNLQRRVGPIRWTRIAGHSWNIVSVFSGRACRELDNL